MGFLEIRELGLSQSITNPKEMPTKFSFYFPINQ